MKNWLKEALIVVTGVLSLVVAMTSDATAGARGKEDFEKAYQAAEASREEAAAAGFEWRDTGKMLAEAKKLADSGDYDAAISLANRARQQGELAVEQAKTEAETWQQRVIK